MGRSDHVLIKVDLQEWALVRKDFKNEALNYSRAIFQDLRRFFGRIDWRVIMDGKTAQEKYEIFLRKYHEGVERYKIKNSKHTWYNAR